MDVPASVSSVYSISLRMSLDQFYSGPYDKYVKLIDFKGTNDGYGLYVFTDQINLYGSDNEYLGGTLTANTYFDILLTRSASNEVKVYLDGSFPPIISFTDTAQDAVPTRVGESSRFRFFHDDAFYPFSQQDEWSTGSVDKLCLWNVALAPAEAGGDGGDAGAGGVGGAGGAGGTAGASGVNGNGGGGAGGDAGTGGDGGKGGAGVGTVGLAGVDSAAGTTVTSGGNGGDGGAGGQATVNGASASPPNGSGGLDGNQSP